MNSCNTLATAASCTFQNFATTKPTHVCRPGFCKSGAPDYIVRGGCMTCVAAGMLIRSASSGPLVRLSCQSCPGRYAHGVNSGNRSKKVKLDNQIWRCRPGTARYFPARIQTKQVQLAYVHGLVSAIKTAPTVLPSGMLPAAEIGLSAHCGSWRFRACQMHAARRLA
eukprot:358772-Chlamydomonas_euryale.AAC.7